MTCARREIVESEEVGVYHCVSRCVRRAFLCGYDKLTGRSYEHRREWMRARLAELSAIFAIEVIAYAILMNHLHALLRIRPDIARRWTAEEVARRWRLLFPLRRVDGRAAEPTKAEIAEITADPAKVALYRARLSSLSWFHRCLNENIARRANAEDRCSGRFWEGRFKCQRVIDVGAILACAAYIDLNPIRAGIAKSLESSDHTSVQDRIHIKTKSRPIRCRTWAHVPLVPVVEFSDNKLTLEQYLEFVDQTGRQIRSGKQQIGAEIAPILERLRINTERWVQTSVNLGRSFRRIIAPVDDIRLAAKRAKKNWLQGCGAARRVFCSNPR